MCAIYCTNLIFSYIGFLISRKVLIGFKVDSLLFADLVTLRVKFESEFCSDKVSLYKEQISEFMIEFM